MGYHYVIMYDGEKIRSCETFEDAQRALKYIPGGTIKSLLECAELPKVKMPKVRYHKLERDLRYKKYQEV